jgi:hypothetical protein
MASGALNNTGMTPQQQAAAQNAAARNAIITQGVERLMQISSAGYNPANQTIVNIQPQNVGLIRGFLVKVEGTITNGGGGTLTRTQYGAANLLKNIGFTDTNNQVRHQTQGWHLNLVNSARQPMVFGAAYAPNVPVNYGNNWTVQVAQTTILTTADAPVQMYYYVPISYGKYDLRGAMWAGVVNAVAQLQLEINPTPCVNTGDPVLAVYAGGAGGVWKAATNVTVTVWQDYIDQIPMAPANQGGQPFLPQTDIATLYQLNTTSMTGMVAGQDFGIPYANFRSFLSTVVRYDNGGVENVGSDINYFALQTANSSNIWKYGPEEAALFARTTFMADPPAGTYYFDSRAKAIATDQFGNTQITMNPSAVSANSQVLIGYEYFSQASQVVFAGSLPSGG